MTAALAPDAAVACADTRIADLFHPNTRGRDGLAAATDTAQRYCAGCPVIDACRRSAGPTDQGLWGGVLRAVDGTGRIHITDLLADPHTTTVRKVSRP